MSDNTPMDQIPEGDVLQDSAGAAPRKVGIPASVKFAALVVTALVVVGGTIFYSAKGQVEPSVTPRGATLDSTPGGQVQAESEVYQDSVRALNDRRVELADQMGATSVPTPEVVMTPVAPITDIEILEQNAPVAETVEEPVPEKKPVVVAERRAMPQPVQPSTSRPAPERVAVAPTSTAPAGGNGGNGQQEVNPYISVIAGQMRAVAGNFVAKPMVAGTVSGDPEDSRNAQAGSGDGAGAGSDTGADGANTAPADLMLRPGDILYAETLTNVNSDMQSPVLAEVVSGEFKGARLTGQFTADKTADRMVVSFTNMTLEDGTVVSVQAFAVDGATAETAVASDVERRYVARYAPIIAASFISGYAQSAAQREETVVGTGDNAQVATNAASAKQSLYAGVAGAAGAVSADILNNAPKGPKIILRDGYPIGIIIIDPVEKP